jgi:hypothetical protein
VEDPHFDSQDLASDGDMGRECLNRVAGNCSARD